MSSRRKRGGGNRGRKNNDVLEDSEKTARKCSNGEVRFVSNQIKGEIKAKLLSLALERGANKTC